MDKKWFVKKIEKKKKIIRIRKVFRSKFRENKFENFIVQILIFDMLNTCCQKIEYGF